MPRPLPQRLRTARPPLPRATKGGASPAPRVEAELAALRRQHAELAQALYEAAQLQRRLCAPRQTRRGALEIAGEIFPVRHLSGDFFKVLDLGASTLVAVGDIAGKGIAAGLWLTHLLGLVRACGAAHPDLAEGVAAINRELCALAAEPPLVALFLARLDPWTGALVYANAGQPPALVVRRGGGVVALQEGGPLAGADPRARFASGRIVLEPGDALLSYTDGILECRNARGEEFGARRLADSAQRAGLASAEQTLFSALGAVMDFAGSHTPEDDLTMVVVHRTHRGNHRAAP